jgi:SAM-dependent MidA family methyltransferase
MTDRTRERPLDPVAAAHGRRLADLMRAEARVRGGLLPFDRFMELALYAPGLGYYAAGARKLGPGGDFVTAPEISPLFGRCIARQCIDVFHALGGGDVLELGAGTGALAADLLSGLASEDRLPRRYLILEPSGDLRHRQRELLTARVPGLIGRVEWLDDLPRDLDGVLLANEVADAIPVHRFVVRDDGSPAEIFVRPAGDGWEEIADEPESPGLADAVAELQRDGLATEPGYVSEINLRLGPWVAALAAAMGRGLALLIDYGYPRGEYYHADRRAGTLMCHYRHRAHGDPYVHVGLQDITAHVDFSLLAASGRAAGLEVAGFATQAHFLMGCGLEELLAEAAGDPEGLPLMLGARQLVMPSGMGERFRVLGLSKGVDRPWRGFSLRDLGGRL